MSPTDKMLAAHDELRATNDAETTILNLYGNLYGPEEEWYVGPFATDEIACAWLASHGFEPSRRAHADAWVRSTDNIHAHLLSLLSPDKMD